MSVNPIVQAMAGIASALTENGMREFRIVLPCPTERVAVELHATLMSLGLPTYRVLLPGSVESPSEAEQRLLPESLTTIREGSFLLVLMPGTLSHLQDSMSGTGGAIRSVAFGSEWPWANGGQSAFDFAQVVLPECVAAWGFADPTYARLWVEIIQAIVHDLDQWQEGRAEFLFDELLSNVCPAEITDVERIEYLCYAAGIPRAEGPTTPEGLADHIVTCRKVVGKALLGRIREPNIRTIVLERARTLAAELDLEYDQLQGVLTRFLDRLGALAMQPAGVLALARGLGASSDWSVDDWRLMSLSVLRRLFLDEAPSGTQELEASAIWQGCESGSCFISLTGKSLACHEGQAPTLKVRVRGAAGLCEIVATVGRRTVARQELAPNQESCDLSIDLADLKAKLRQVVRVDVISPVARSRTEMVLFLVSFSATPVAIAERTVAGGSDKVEVLQLLPADNELGSIVADHDTTLHFPPCGVHEIAQVGFDGTPSELAMVSGRYPTLALTGKQFAIAGNGSLLSVDVRGESFAGLLVGGDRGRGPATVHDALLHILRNGNRQRVSDVYRVFTNENSSDPFIGTPRSQAYQFLIELASAFEESAAVESSYPVLLDFNSTRSGPSQVRVRGGVRYVDSDTVESVPAALRFEGALTPTDQALLNAYCAARAAFMSLVEAQFFNSMSGGRANYASLPLCHPDPVLRKDVESALGLYLDSYTRVLDSLRGAAPRRAYFHQFMLANLDTVVHSGTGPRVALLGPWHPLVAASRFFAQANILQLVAESGPDPDVSLLVEVFARVTSFRWVPGLGADTLPVPFYSGPTEDAGWYAIAESKGDSLDESQYLIMNAFGIEASLVPEPAGVDIAKYLELYLRAFPSRRAIAAWVDGSYDEERVMDLVRPFLFTPDGKKTSRALSLPGGIHLHIPGVVPSEDNSPSWTEPPICIYSGEGDMDTRVDLVLAGSKAHPDFEPIADVTSRLAVARGGGDACILMIPSREVVAGRDAVPGSASDETSMLEPSVSGASTAFLAALVSAQEAGGALRLTKWRLPVGGTDHARWVVLPGGHADPAVLLEWSRASLVDRGKERFLWDYRISPTGGFESFYIISALPRGFVDLVQGSFLPTPAIAEDAIRVLVGIGIGVGNETYRSRTNALGVIGLIGAARVVEGLRGDCDDQSALIVLPVDSFTDVLGKEGFQPRADDGEPLDRRFCDLLAVRIQWSGSDFGAMSLRFSGIESKYRNREISLSEATTFAGQAQVTVDRVEMLARQGVKSSAHRWVIAKLVEHGLRLGRFPPHMQRGILNALLRGEYQVRQARTKALLVSTEEGRTDCRPQAIQLVNGCDAWWVKLGPSHFPRMENDSAFSEAIFGIPRFCEAPVTSSAATNVSTARGVGADPSSTHVPVAPDPAPITGADETETSPELDVPVIALLRTGSRASLGITEDHEIVAFDTEDIGQGVENYNLMVTGSSGKGKTQLIKSIAVQLAERNLPLLFLDFKNDFASDQDFLRYASLEPQWIAHDGLPFNPMIPAASTHPGTGESYFDLPQHLSGVQAALQRAYGLGEQQAGNALRTAMRKAYLERGIDPSVRLDVTERVEWPDFNDIARELEAADPKAFTRLTPLFDLGIFRNRFRDVPFSSLLSRKLVLDLSQIQSQRVKETLAHLLIYSAHRYLNAQEHATTLRELIVIDEAHWVLNSPDLEAFTRECRAYGVGVLLSSQNPGDFPPTVQSNLATKIIHGNGPDAARVSAIRQLTGLPDPLSKRIAALSEFSAIVTAGTRPARFVDTIGYGQLLLLQRMSRDPAGALLAELQEVSGVIPSRVDEAVKRLIRIGLATRVEGRVLATPDGRKALND